MKNGILVFLCIVLTNISLSAQINRYGIPFVKNITPEETNASEQNWSVAQDQRGIIYVANNDNGILEYDGNTWRKIALPNSLPLRDLCVDDQGTVYAGGDKEFGFLEPDAAGNLHYHSLVNKLDSADRQFNTIYYTYFWRGNVYFATQNIIFQYSPALDSIRIYKLKDDGFKYGNFSFICNDRFFHVDAAQGLLEFDGHHFKKVKNGSFFAYNNVSSILSILPYSSSELLIATYKSGVYSYNPETGSIRTSIFSSRANDYLKNKWFYHGRMLPDSSYAMATLTGGLAIISHDGILKQIIKRGEGLKNDAAVTKVFYNKKYPDVSQLWMSLAIGLANVEWFSPFRYFSENQGFKGTVNDILVIGNKIYLATSAGVFYRTKKKGIASFERIPGINAQAWSFLYFRVPGISQPLFWAGTEEGIYQISDNGKVTLIENRLKNLKPRGKKFYVFKLYHSSHYPNKVFIGTGHDLAILIYRNHNWYVEEEFKNLQDEVRSITEDNKGNIWISLSFQGIVRLQKNGEGKDTLIIYGTKKGLPAGTGKTVNYINNKILVYTDKGLYSYSEDADTLMPDPFLGTEYADGSRSVRKIFSLADSMYFLNVLYPDGKYHVEEVIKSHNKTRLVKTPFLRLPNQSAYTFAREDNRIWIAISNRIYSYDFTYKEKYNIPFHTLIRKISISGDSVLYAGAFFREDGQGIRHFSTIQSGNYHPEIKYAFNNMTFYWACPFFEDHEGITYSFRLRNFDRNWSRWTNRVEYPYTNIPSGDYIFEVKARNIYGQESTTGSFSFTILPPWYLTVWAFLLYFILALLLIVIIVKLYTRRLQHEKIRLEEIVRERTAEVVRQKEELTDSITYASRIQRAVLPSEKLLNEQFPDHFILFKPRDIVSGDFYWMTKQNDQVLITAADCTGHGVPGAFMSLLGISFLNEIVNRSDIHQPNQILNELRDEVMQSLKQKGEEGETKDGMDMALVSIDKKNKKLYFSGAYNPLYFVRKLTPEEKKKIKSGEKLDFGKGSLYNDQYVLIQISSDKMPIGISVKDEQSFSLHEISYSPGDRIYMSSDGYIDQFGGPEGKKYMSRNFKKLILSIQKSTLKEQGKLLDDNIIAWMGDIPQVDDIIVIGIKL